MRALAKSVLCQGALLAIVPGFALGTSVSSVAPANIKPTSVGPDMEISMPDMPVGNYTLKAHIRGAGGKIYTASFTLDVR